MAIVTWRDFRYFDNIARIWAIGETDGLEIIDRDVVLVRWVKDAKDDLAILALENFLHPGQWPDPEVEVRPGLARQGREEAEDGEEESNRIARGHGVLLEVRFSLEFKWA
jgi:hypothetical protein